MTWFQSFRGQHGFMFYGDQTSPTSLDKPLVAVVYLCVLVSGATLLATLGIRGREKWSHAIRASYGVAIASIILICLVSHGWMEGHVEVKAPYVYRSNMHFHGDLSLRIGLRSANITLDGTYLSPSGGKQVYYVETLPWPDYGSERLSYWSQLERGLPGPILRVMDFLTYDNGDLQWGKSFRTAGQFTWALLWTSFVFWLLSNLLLFSVVMYGAYMFFLAGVTLLMACVAFSQGLNSQPLQMTFGQHVLKLEYGWSFWLAIVAGSLTTLLGIILIITDIFLHQKVAEFFHLEKDWDEDDSSCKQWNSDGSPRKLNARSKSESFISQQGRPYQPSRVNNDRKPSLATLKEHRENHANERISNSTKSNLDKSTLSRSLNSVRSPEHQRFLYDTAESIQLRSAASVQQQQNGGGGGTGSQVDGVHRPDSSETVVEAVVENHRVKDVDRDIINSSQLVENSPDVVPETQDASVSYRTQNSLEASSCCSLGEDAVFDSSANSRRVSAESSENRGQAVRVTVIEVSGNNDQETLPKEVEIIPEKKHVSIQIEH